MLEISFELCVCGMHEFDEESFKLLRFYGELKWRMEDFLDILLRSIYHYISKKME